MTTYFDGIAADYDVDFTNSGIGRLQRKQVWSYLSRNVLGQKKLNILEFNCGTGEDALHFSTLGHSVIATDLSEKMLEAGRAKSANAVNRPDFRRMDLRQASTLSGNKFDLVFSNFGGLNCISPQDATNFLGQLPSLLAKGGRFIAVIMPPFCATESAYFLLKLKFDSILRRRKNQIAENEYGQIPVWYYSPGFVRKQLSGNLKVAGLRGIGTMVPPSFVEEKMKSLTGMLTFFNKADEFLSSYSAPAYFSDHYLIDAVLS